MNSSSATDTPEIQTKQQRLGEFFDRHGLDAALFWARNNFAWITAGGDNRIPDAGEHGVAGILATRDKRYCLADTIEAPRMRDEELVDTDIEVIDYPWYDTEASKKRVRELLGDLGLSADKVAADLDKPAVGFAPLPGDFARLRWQLTPQEIERYHEGASRAAGAMEQAAEAVDPGMTEGEISGILDHYMRAAGLVPTVNLIATDERIFNFRHPIPTDRELERYVMMVSCASFGGLISNLTRFVHFGKIPDELAKKQQAVANVDAIVNLATRPGRTLGEVFADLQQAYAASGFPDEWQLHHQGGSTGYAGRDVFATPGDGTEVLENQAFAWNPSIKGAKSEDTVLITADGLEVLTGHSDSWPTIEGHTEEGDLPRAACLVR